MSAAFQWIVENWGKTSGIVAALLGIISGAAYWFANADQVHAQTAQQATKIEAQQQQIQTIVDGLNTIYKQRELEASERRVRAEEEAKRREMLASLCTAGKLKDRLECAKVGVIVGEAE